MRPLPKLAPFKKDLPFVFVVWLVFSCAAGFRVFGVDRDYDQYKFFYDSIISQLSFSDFRFEPGFVLWAWICKGFLGLAFDWFLVASAGIAIGIKLFLFYRKPYFWIVLAAYIPTLYLLHDMTQVRASLAVAFVFLGLYLRFNGVRFVSLVLLFVAISMQATSAVLAPFFIVPISWFAQRSRLWIVLLVLLVGVPGILKAVMDSLEAINPLVAHYVSSVEDAEPNMFSVRSIGLLVISFFGLFQIGKLDVECRVFIMVGVLGLVIFVAMQQVPVFAHRLLELLSFSYFLWVTRVRALRFFVCSVFVLISFYIGYRQIFIDPLFG